MITPPLSIITLSIFHVALSWVVLVLPLAGSAVTNLQHYPKRGIFLEQNFVGNFNHHFIGLQALTSV